MGSVLLNTHKSTRTSARRAIGAMALLVVLLTCSFALVACSDNQPAGDWVYPSKATTSSDGAAAQFNGNKYIPEEAVSDYIALYREQMGLEDDDAWAEFLVSYGYTAESFRLMTIQQLVEDELVLEKTAELGITVTEDEVDQVIANFRSYYAFDDDDIWQDNLDTYGITETELRQTYYLELLREKLEEDQVEQTTPTDDEVLTYIKTYTTALGDDERLAKHTYCFRLSADKDGDLTNSTLANEVHDALVGDDLSVETFATAVTMYSDDEDLVEKTGANGWNIDSSDYTETYLNYLEELDEGQMSEVFIDEDGSYCIIYVDDTYTFPSTSEEIESMSASSMPDSLYEYMTDSCAYAQWVDACDVYIPGLLDDADVVVYDMPADVAYNVDTSSVEADEDASATDTEESAAEE